MTITVSRIEIAKTAQTISIGSHHLTADMGVADGGLDAGPDPHDLYDSALGACKALTVIWYANRKQIPLEHVKVAVERDDSQERKGTYVLTATLSLGGPLSHAQHAELLAVADKCPVHKLMTEVTTIVHTRLAAKAAGRNQGECYD